MVRIAEYVPKPSFPHTHQHAHPPLGHLRSPSTSTVSSASWTDEPRQRPLCKTTSLPVPSSPTAAAALPRRGRLPQAQVFVSRPSTPNNLSRDLTQFAQDRARLLAATRRERGPAPDRPTPRCTSDIAAVVAASAMRRPMKRESLQITGATTGSNTSSTKYLQLPTSPCTPRVRSPLPVGADFEPLPDIEPMEDGASSPRVGTPAPSFWRVAAHFECANLYDAPSAPAPTLTPASAPAQARARKESEPSHSHAIPHHALSTPELLRAEMGSASSGRTSGRDSTPPRVLSFDSYRLTKTKREQRERRGLPVEEHRADDYIGFMRVAPTRYETLRHKSRALLARLLGRRFEHTHTQSSRGVRSMRTMR